MTTATTPTITDTAYVNDIGATLIRDHGHEARLNRDDYNHAMRIVEADGTTAGHAIRDARTHTWIAIIRTDDPTRNRVIGTRLDTTNPEPELLPAISPSDWTQFHSSRAAAATLLRLLATDDQPTNRNPSPTA
ncbi:hypothetical protein ACFWPX_30115 [Nocardia sp. NPDC058518]|uniref:hypothetical protein n=1 Tax=Nocardia sp. NPDC058518 TaxID=3346534 RepID=UPI0036545358